MTPERFYEDYPGASQLLAGAFAILEQRAGNTDGNEGDGKSNALQEEVTRLRKVNKASLAEDGAGEGESLGEDEPPPKSKSKPKSKPKSKKAAEGEGDGEGEDPED